VRMSAIFWIATYLCSTVSLGGGTVAASSEKQRSSHQITGASARDGRPKVAPTAVQIREDLRRKVNSGLVGVVLGVTELESPALFKDSDFFASLERDNSLRIFQVAGKGAAQNVIELGFARGIDAGIIQSDILDSVRLNPPFAGIESFLQYVAKLYDKEVHVLATANINSIEDLRGRKVNFGTRNSDNFITATKIFGILSIDVEPAALPHDAALEKLREGEIAAMVYVVDKPADLFNFRTKEKLHFISIPSTVRGGYTPTNLQAEDYPELIEQDKPIETLAVGSILMVYNWSRGTDRYRKVARFVEKLLDHTNTNTTPTHYPKWPEVDISASVPGWTRFAPAEQWIKAHSNEQTNHHALLSVPENGSAALKLHSGAQPPSNRADLNDLFTDFVEYQKQQQVKLFTQFLEYQERQQNSTRHPMRADHSFPTPPFGRDADRVAFYRHD
jgi:TRAP-type uncharacterized transport system substrate-binding protein